MRKTRTHAERCRTNEQWLFDPVKAASRDDYQPVTSVVAPHLEVRWTADHGRYLVTTERIAKGTVLWTEEPALWLQSLPNVAKLQCCAMCCRAVGTLENQLRLVLGQEEPVEPLISVDRPHALCDTVLCSCSTPYCSPKCQQRDLSHVLLCVGPLESLDHPLLAFKRYAIQHNEIFLLAAKFYSLVLHRLASRTKADVKAMPVDELIWPFSLLMRAPWSECVVYESALTEEELQDPDVAEYCSKPTASELKKQCKKVHGLLRKALTSSDITSRVKGLADIAPAVFDKLDVSFLEDLIGMFEINCSAISFYGPAMDVLNDDTISEEARFRALTRMWNAADEADHGECDSHSEGDEIDDETPKAFTHDAVVEVSERLPSFDGIAIFHRISVMQHSCDPNVVTRFGNDFVAEVVSLRDIEAGEDVTHSYIEEDYEYEKRTLVLRLWGFKGGCVCKKCKEKK